MYRESHYLVEKLNGKELDDYLAKGWYRSGQIIFTTHLIRFENDIYSPVWTRLGLKGFQFKKRLRKLLRQNKQRFRTEYGPFQITPETEKLYQLHSKRFSGFPPTSLENYLLDKRKHNYFETIEARLYDEDEQLAGISYFDVGEKSLTSILALFHPKYEKYSLGIYTLLLEIEYAMERDMDYHYSGYIVPDYPKFDYKKKVGPLDFYDLYDKQWKPLGFLNIHNLPSYILKEKILLMQFCLYDLNIPSTCFVFHVYDRKRFSEADFLTCPLVLSCFQDTIQKQMLFVEYDLIKEVYRLSICKEARFDTYYWHFKREAVLAESPLPDVIGAALVARYRKYINVL